VQLSGTDAGNYYLSGGSSFSGNDGVITPKTITISAPAVSKVYDGQVAYTASAGELLALSTQLGVAGDTINGIAMTFDNKNVGTGKTVTPSAADIADGNGGQNYVVTYAANTNSTVTRLNSVTWIGGSTGNWFDPANWAGGAVPDLSNVANVVIPSGTQVSFNATVVAPAESGPVHIDGLGAAGGGLAMSAGTLDVGAGGIALGSVTQSGGTLNSAGAVQLDTLEQTGGTLAIGSDLNVSTSFSQSDAGTIAVAGQAAITDLSGGVTLGNLQVAQGLSVTSQRRRHHPGAGQRHHQRRSDLARRGHQQRCARQRG